jgi:hypothetical protein
MHRTARENTASQVDDVIETQSKRYVGTKQAGASGFCLASSCAHTACAADNQAGMRPTTRPTQTRTCHKDSKYGVGARGHVQDVCDSWQRRRRVKIVLFLQYAKTEEHLQQCKFF